MKHIKLFEDYVAMTSPVIIKPGRRSWLVRVDYPYLETSLEKIGYVFDVINTTDDIREYAEAHNNIEKILIYTFIDKNKMFWSFSYQQNNVILRNYEFMGEVEVTPEDIENWKIKNTANKYNL